MSKITHKTISFSVDGPAMTQLAREFCYQEKNIPKAFQLLWELTMADGVSDGDHTKLVLDILNEKMNIVGVYPNDDYGIEEANEPVKGLEQLLNDIRKETQAQKKRIQQLTLQRNWLISSLQEEFPISFQEYLDRYKEDFEESMLTQQEMIELGIPFRDHSASAMSPMLSEFLERNTADYDTDNDYGWLEPNGTFHPVPWGEHYEWASDYIQEHYAEDHILTNDMINDPGDYLLQRSWVLLHNPAQGIARTSIHPTKRYTKAQQDFLYGYYIDRNHPELANQIMQEM